MHLPSKMVADVSKWKPDPCEGPSCPYSKNLQTAQCVLGPELIEPFDSLKNFEGPKLIANLSEEQLAQDPKKPGMAKSSDMRRKSANYLKLEKKVRN